MAYTMEIHWQDMSEDDEEQYRFLVPGIVLADLFHHDYTDSWGEREDSWRLCLTKRDDKDELVTLDHDLDREGVVADEVKAWAEPLVAEFLGS